MNLTCRAKNQREGLATTTPPLPFPEAGALGVREVTGAFALDPCCVSGDAAPVTAARTASIAPATLEIEGIRTTVSAINWLYSGTAREAEMAKPMAIWMACSGSLTLMVAVITALRTKSAIRRCFAWGLSFEEDATSAT
jgi:hypothetical protein